MSLNTAKRKHERKWRCVPELENHPRQPDAEHQLAVNADVGAAAEIGIDDQLLDLIFAQLHLGSRRDIASSFLFPSLPLKSKRAVLAARYLIATAVAYLIQPFSL